MGHEAAYWRTPVTVPDIVDPGKPSEFCSEFASIAQYLPTLCWIAEGDGSIFWYNLRWHDYCGTTAEDMEGWGWQSVHHPDYLPVVMNRWTSAISAGLPFEMTFPLRGADGVYRPFLTRVIPVRNAQNTVVRWYGVNTEISAQAKAERELEASEARYRLLTDTMPQMVWSTLPDGYHDFYNQRWYDFTGVPAGSTDGEGWNEMFHPDDRERAWARWQHSLDTGEEYEIEYRLRHHSGNYRWVLGRALPMRDEHGAISRWIGTCTDIDDTKRIAEQNELLTRELSHRIKNIFAVISGLISLIARRAGGLRHQLDDIQGRINALGRAHNFARPHSLQSQPENLAGTLRGLLRELLNPYELNNDDRITIDGSDFPIDDRSATPIALTIHELATNCTKYGSLSTANGKLNVTIACEDDIVTIRWVERGGPPITRAPENFGFGTDLSDLSIRRQLGGAISYDWREEGLTVTIELNASSLHREN